MGKKRNALGRGLGALLGDSDSVSSSNEGADVMGGNIKEIPISGIDRAFLPSG